MTKITSVEIIEYLREIDRKKQGDSEDDGFRTTREISGKLGISVRKVRTLLRDLDDMEMLEIEKVRRKVLGGFGAVLAYRLKDVEINSQ